MRIFDNILLKQYLDVGAELKVYANDDWYTIADKSDVADSIDAVGQDEYGAPHRFSYTNIKQIQVNGETITLDALAAKFGDKPADTSGEKSPKSSGGSEAPDLGSDEEPSDEEPKKGGDSKGPDLSWFSPAYDVGRILMREKEERNKKRGNKI